MAAVKRKNEADFLAAVMREFAQWLRREPRRFALFAPSDRCFLSLHQVSYGGRNSRAGKLACYHPAEKRLSRIANPRR
jgi:hypothetical protein